MCTRSREDNTHQPFRTWCEICQCSNRRTAYHKRLQKDREQLQAQTQAPPQLIQHTTGALQRRPVGKHYNHPRPQQAQQAGAVLPTTEVTTKATINTDDDTTSHERVESGEGGATTTMTTLNNMTHKKHLQL